jgi:hypothetical protein
MYSMLWILIAVVLFVLSLIGLGFSAYFWWQSRRYTRYRFAFAGLTAITGLGGTAIMALSGTTPWDAILAGLGYVSTGELRPAEASWEGRLLVF